jgi:hypothetical protein
LPEKNDVGGQKEYRERLGAARDFGSVWDIVKDAVKTVLQQYRVGMMLFLDDLPLHLGAYHPVGTNNIIMNRHLLEVVSRNVEAPLEVNAFAFNILLHEYLHAIGYLHEGEVRALVYKIARACFGEDHAATRLTSIGPWSVLKAVPLAVRPMSKRSVEIVRDFDTSSRGYIS